MPDGYMRSMKAFFKGKLKRLFKRQQAPVQYFVHIPKTAGTSFIVLLDRFYPADHIFPHQLWRETNEVDLHHNAQYELFRGHFGGGGVDVLTDRPIEYLTLLRDPRELARSTYHYVQRETNTKVHQLVNDLHMSFADFLAHPVTVPLVQNRLIRNISFDFKLDPAAQEVFLSSETIAYLQQIIQQQEPAIDDDQRLQRARKMLQSCRWFGLVERFDESMQLLCYVMRWPPIGPTQKLNTQTTKYTLNEAETTNLELMNQQDLKFYQEAQHLFQHQLEGMHENLDKLRTDAAQSVDDLLDLRYQQHQAKRMQGQLPRAANYDFGDRLYGQQWHRREIMQPESDYFRWTGPGDTAFIDFWLQPLAYQISIRIINATTPEALDRLTITLNDQPIAWQSDDQGVVRVLHLSCQASDIKNTGLARLGLHCDAVTSHQQAFGSDDTRLVGVAVHWIKFNHVN